MATRNETLGSASSPRTGKHSPAQHRPREEETPSANHFIKVHESHVPRAGESPVFHEDERYETLAGPEEEQMPKIYEHFRILYGAGDCDADSSGEPARPPSGL